MLNVAIKKGAFSAEEDAELLAIPLGSFSLADFDIADFEKCDDQRRSAMGPSMGKQDRGCPIGVSWLADFSKCFVFIVFIYRLVDHVCKV